MLLLEIFAINISRLYKLLHIVGLPWNRNDLGSDTGIGKLLSYGPYVILFGEGQQQVVVEIFIRKAEF